MNEDRFNHLSFPFLFPFSSFCSTPISDFQTSSVIFGIAHFVSFFTNSSCDTPFYSDLFQELGCDSYFKLQ